MEVLLIYLRTEDFMADKPKMSNSASQRELDRVEKQLSEFEGNIKDLREKAQPGQHPVAHDAESPMSQADLRRAKEIYLKPTKTISTKEPFNEKYRDDYEFAKDFVCFIAENHEIIGESICTWTKPFAGICYEYWEVPVNKPVWGPRHLAESIKKCSYHVFSMDQAAREMTGVGTMYGNMVVDTVKQRLDARPVSSRRSVFMGS